jgi:RNA polymerase sigma-70 factor (sigma-E family)
MIVVLTTFSRPPHLNSVDSLLGAEATPTAAGELTALYRAHALGLVRLAVLLLGDQPSAEDVVQDAFLGLHRRWSSLTDTGKALAYVRASVLNGCRMAHRSRSRRDRALPAILDVAETGSAEESALLAEEHREVLAALRRLPARQREAVVLRYYLDMTEDQAAQAMRVSKGTVKSATSRGLATLARQLKEEPAA